MNLSGRLQEMELKLADRMGGLKQYQWQNNIRILGMEETEDEDTAQLVGRLCQDEVSVEVPKATVCRSHQVRKNTEPTADGKKKHRPIIVHFTGYRALEGV